MEGNEPWFSAAPAGGHRGAGLRSRLGYRGLVSRRPWMVPPIWRGAAAHVRRRAAGPGEPPPGSRHSGMTVQGQGEGDLEAAHTDPDQCPELQQLEARRAAAASGEVGVWARVLERSAHNSTAASWASKEAKSAESLLAFHLRRAMVELPGAADIGQRCYDRPMAGAGIRA